MDDFLYSELLKKLKIKVNNIESVVKPNKIDVRLKEIETLEQDEKFWNDIKKAGEIAKEKNRLISMIKKFNDVKILINDAKDLFDMAKDENDADTLETLFNEALDLENKIKKTEVQVMLNGETDSNNAIVTIHPGAGGTESQDWANMLYRMYLRWAERKGFKIELLDYQAGEEVGIKDVSFIIKGENSYGYLKTENGIHRLVRISPFDSNSKRHTSFSSVMVSPEIDDNIDIQWEDKEVRIDTYRASGAGGQHINKTESAIRITHIETNVVVQCQNDRSQHKNKASAIKMLKSRLYELELEKQRAEKNNTPKSEIGWGHQIRSYVMQPYQQVKDNRSNEAYSNIENILDGDINKIIEDVLISNFK